MARRRRRLIQLELKKDAVTTAAAADRSRGWTTAMLIGPALSERETEAKQEGRRRQDGKDGKHARPATVDANASVLFNRINFFPLHWTRD